MKSRFWSIVLLGALLVGCGSPPPPAPTATAPLPTAAPTMGFAAPKSVGAAFLAAWEAADYARMYSLLAPSLQTGLSAADFEQAYHTALESSTTLTVTARPQQLTLEDDQAWIIFETTWETALFGNLQSSNQLRLKHEQGQWWLNWQRSTIWPELAEGNNFVLEYQVPPRANIYARDGTGLAIPSSIVTVGVIPGEIQDETVLLSTLAPILGMPSEEIQAEYAGQPANWFIPISDISGEESLAYDEALNLPGIERRESPGRLYPLAGVGSHVVGWVSPIPADAAAAYRQMGYRRDAKVGIAGLEAWGEDILAGKNGGRLYLVDSAGNYLQGLAEQRPIQGRALYTTLDREWQQQLEQLLGNQPGAVVAMDVQSGALRALVSGPGFDNNIFVRPTDAWQRQAILTDPTRPLLNRATQGTYPLGSVFKIVTMAAGLESGNAVSTTPFYCPGHWDGLGIANRKSCWLTSGHGNINLKQGLIASCDIVFYELGKILDYADPEILPTYGGAFGFGKVTGLPELAEAEGLLPNPEWKQATYSEGWATGDTVNLAIGQGFLLVTPLQVAQMLAAVANGGTLYRPYLVAQIGANSTHPEQITAPQAVGQLPLSTDHLTLIQEALWDVTRTPAGTASHRFQELAIPVAGKTGTAQAPGETALPHAWFAGYFPADEPEIALVVMVANSGEGSAIAAPLFRQIVEAYYDLPLTPLPVTP
ncbi:MAG: penicillin-binding protein 2 [Chloroflexota bacterium]|nr:penicillin-binding protein 2 [Chloroflexota bacterium]